MVYMYRYVTKGTFDGYLWQIQEQKLKYISQVMTGKSISRSCSDMDETVLSAAEVKAIATDNPLLAEKMSVDNEVARLQLLRNDWESERINLQNRVDKIYPEKIEKIEVNMNMYQLEIAHLKANPLSEHNEGKEFSIALNSTVYANRTEAFEELSNLMKHENLKNGKEVELGEYRGFKLMGKYNIQNERTIYINYMRKNPVHSVTFKEDAGIGNFVRINNKLNGLSSELEMKKLERDTLKNELAMAKKEIANPFKHEKELSDLLTKQTEINTKLELGDVEKSAKKERDMEMSL